jgi:predicted nucleic acid-binding protein
VKTFVDTNVLLYAYDNEQGAKGLQARSIVADLWRSGEGIVSIQVLQEFHVNLLRKRGTNLSRIRLRGVIRRYAQWVPRATTTDDVLDAIDLEQRHTLSFWDALVVITAARSGAERLLTEDMQHGRTIAGVRIVNPFVDMLT